MEQKTYELPFQERCLLPVNESAVPLLITLDSLALDVMIIDEQTKICFINSHYLQSYGEYWEKIGIPAKQIPGTVLLQMKNPDMAALDRLLNLIRNSLASDNYYYEDFGFSGLSDVVRIDTPSFKGAAVIQTHNDLISELSVSVAYYKDLYKQAQQQLLSKEKLPFHFQQIVGTSPQFVKILHLAARVAQTDSSVCISGESGTGKEVLAGAIHYSSQYASGPFIRVNCAAIPESLMESELFGYEKGAFTGANTNGKAGKFELANNGTLFLDEIGEMPVSMQVKLLRALQEREITRIGGSKPIKLNFRLITATNRDLEKMVADGTFREDIYYRICIIPLQLPPLRDRRTDIPLLSDMFLSSLDMPQWENRHFSTDVSDHFLRYSWPGNIRELKNCVERMAILCPTEEISADYLPANIISSLAETDKNAATPPLSAESYNLKDLIEKTEYDAIKSVLSLTGGNKAKAIKILGISKRNFYMKLEKFHLK